MTARPSDATTVLRARSLTKAFGATVALADVDFDIHRGEVVALVGENGAGKSTLKNLLCGLLAPDSGTLELEGRPLEDLPVHEAGVAAVHQEFSLFGAMSVAENIAIADLPGRGPLVSWGDMRTIATEQLRQVGAPLQPETLVDSLNTGHQQLVEVAKALRQASRVLILDEPTASLSAPERERLFTVVRELRDRGLAIMFISHFLDEVYAIADRIVVLRDGRHVATAEAANLPRAELEALMVGRPISERRRELGEPASEVVLSVNRLTAEPYFRDVSFTVRKGEIMGVAGLMGAGRTEMVEAIYGLRSASGDVSVEGEPMRERTPAAMKRRRVAFVPEDRRRHGLFGNRSVRENLTAATLPSHRSLLRPGRERHRATALGEDLRIAHPSLEAPVRVLSGGNQQKTLLGRWLALEPRVCILDEPTRGVDIGAKEEIHDLVTEYARRGMAIILVSSELSELMELAHRVLVLHKGRLTTTLPRERFEPRVVLEQGPGRKA